MQKKVKGFFLHNSTQACITQATQNSLAHAHTVTRTRHDAIQHNARARTHTQADTGLNPRSAYERGFRSAWPSLSLSLVPA